MHEFHPIIIHFHLEQAFLLFAQDDVQFKYAVQTFPKARTELRPRMLGLRKTVEGKLLRWVRSEVVL